MVDFAGQSGQRQEAARQEVDRSRRLPRITARLCRFPGTTTATEDDTFAETRPEERCSSTGHSLRTGLYLPQCLRQRPRGHGREIVALHPDQPRQAVCTSANPSPYSRCHSQYRCCYSTRLGQAVGLHSHPAPMDPPAQPRYFFPRRNSSRSSAREHVCMATPSRSRYSYLDDRQPHSSSPGPWRARRSLGPSTSSSLPECTAH